jgi:hypothetical protein
LLSYSMSPDGYRPAKCEKYSRRYAVIRPHLWLSGLSANYRCTELPGKQTHS